MKKIVIFMGVPGMNNIELARYLQVTKYPEGIIIDRYDSWLKHKDLKYESSIIELDMYNSILEKLKSTDTIFVVAPFVLKADRSNFFSYLKANIDNLNDIKIIGVWVERKYEDLVKLRELRLSYRLVSDEVFERLYKYRESPSPDEPFDDLVYLTREIDKGMSKNFPYITDILTTLERI